MFAYRCASYNFRNGYRSLSRTYGGTSTHTGGFTGYTYRDLTNDIPSIADHWKSLDLKFDAVATGYLGSFEQIKIVSDFFDKFKTLMTTL